MSNDGRLAVTAPRLEINLAKISHNASILVNRLRQRGIAVTGVTKACMGHPDIASTFLSAGVHGLGDSRIENIETMRRAGIEASITLIRAPMLSQVDRVIANADVSLNTELDVVSALSDAAGKAGLRHGVLLMLELGDLREGIMAKDLEAIVCRVLRFPNIDLRGIGANLACFNGIAPDANNMRELSNMANHLDFAFGNVARSLTKIVSGGNSSNLRWALDACTTGRINDLRLGEAMLLGVDPLGRIPIEGLFSDAITLFAEVIEAKIKPSVPWGDMGQATFEHSVQSNCGDAGARMILAIGQQDIDPAGLAPPDGIEIAGASSDHLVVTTTRPLERPGCQIAFKLNYSALLRAMTSPFVHKVFRRRGGLARPRSHVLHLAPYAMA